MSVKDAQLLQVTGLTPKRAGAIVGKSRQAVSRGLGLKVDYFKAVDVQKICIRVENDSPELSDRIRDFVRTNYVELASYFAAPVSRIIDFATASRAASKIWIVAPDYVGLFLSPTLNPPLYEILKRRDTEVTVFVSGEVDADRFEALLERIAPDNSDIAGQFQVLEKCALIEQIPPMTVLEPTVSPASFVGTAEGWTALDARDAQRIVDSILTKLRRDEEAEQEQKAEAA